MTADDKKKIGETFVHKGVTYYVGWMRSVDGSDDFGMWLNEQPNGGFAWEFLDFEPDYFNEYQKIYISAEDPRLAK